MIKRSDEFVGQYKYLVMLLVLFFIYSSVAQYTFICCKEKVAWRFQNFSLYSQGQIMYEMSNISKRSFLLYHRHNISHYRSSDSFSFDGGNKSSGDIGKVIVGNISEIRTLGGGGSSSNDGWTLYIDNNNTTP